MKGIMALIKFSRPHTIIGTTLSVIGLYVIALSISPTSELHLMELAMALISCLAANIYIVGLNQITDVDIDRINKPNLPLPAGDFSIGTAKVIILIGFFLALFIAKNEGVFLFTTISLSLLIGTLYSLPPFRLKRFHFWAAFCIFTVRGLIVNILLFLHFNFLLSGSTDIPHQIWILTAFMFGLSLVIAWFKDMPDIAGDRIFKIITLSLRFGPRRVFQIGRWVLTFCYALLILMGILGIEGINQLLLVSSHSFLLFLMWMISLKIEATDKASISKYYLFIWTLFFAEYIVFPLSVLTA
jgi:homogentisate phytyltransferase/homogentisate geranylgeranyltransferase